MDRISKEKRSLNMAKIGSKNTQPELLMFKLLKDHNLKFKKHYDTFGKPDIAFPEIKIAVFVNGEFWHGRNFSKIKDRLADFWKDKIGKNIRRDRKNYKLLKNNGWEVIIIWDKDLKKNPNKELSKILSSIKRFKKKNVSEDLT